MSGRKLTPIASMHRKNLREPVNRQYYDDSDLSSIPVIIYPRHKCTALIPNKSLAFGEKSCKLYAFLA